MNRFLVYSVARHNARELDRQGKPPGLLIRVVIGSGLLAVAGLCVVVAIGALDFAAWSLGII